ncbi:MAG: sensor histidine kinase, partial [Anaerolineae bacterium]
MSETVVPSLRGFRAVDIADLRARVLPPVTFLVLFASALGAWYLLPGEVFRWRQWLILALATAFVASSWWLQRTSQLAGGLSLVLAAYALAIVAVLLHQGVAASFLLGLAVILAIVLVRPWAPVAAAVGASLVALALHGWASGQLHPGIVIPVYLLTGGILFFGMNSSYQILQWAWNRHSQAQSLAEQLRDRQEQLNRTIKALDLAYRLLQRSNHELAVAREEAEEARRLKERFAASISHELRTPLNLILGFSELMYMSPHVYGDMEWTPPLRRDVAQVYSASRHLSQLVDDVLDLSRLNAERMPLRKALCDLGDIIEEAVATVRDLIRERPLAIEVQLDTTVPRMLVDGTRIRQVILNLLNNAIRFTNEGKIVVRSQRLEREVLLSVQDTGPGIPADELESIFDEFYQASVAT